MSKPSYIFQRRLRDGSLDPEFSYQFRYTVGGKERRHTGKVPECCTTRAQAAAWAQARMKELRSAEAREAMLEYLNGKVKRKRTGCTIGDVIARVEDPAQQTRKTLADQRRMVNSLRRVLAHALDLWAVHEGGVAGVKIGDKIADKAKVDALPATVLNAETVRRYFMASLNVETLNWMQVHEDARSINSTLGHARGIFQGLTKDLLEGLALPDVSGFLKRRLRAPKDTPEPVEAREFAVMVEHFDGLRESRPDLWLCNAVLRQTGMRAGTVAAFDMAWLRKLDDGWWCDIREGKDVKTTYSVPLADDLVAAFRRFSISGFSKALLDEHTAMLKGVIGAGTGGQVNHRLRDTVASALYHWLGIAVAQEALGHANEKVTRDHYARRMDVSDLMKREMDAWKRVVPAHATGSGLPGNVVTMPAAQAA